MALLVLMTLAAFVCGHISGKLCARNSKMTWKSLSHFSNYGFSMQLLDIFVLKDQLCSGIRKSEV